MSQLNVDTIGSQTGTTISIASGHTLSGVAGLNLLHSSTFSTVSSKSIDSVFSSTYKNYKINLSILSSNTTDYMFRLRDGSGDVTTSSYSWKYMYTINDDNWVAHTSGSNVNYVEYISAGGGNANHYNGIFEFFNPNTTDNTTFQWQGNRESRQMLMAAGGFAGSTQFTGITFYNTSNTISGEIQIYGYAK